MCQRSDRLKTCRHVLVSVVLLAVCLIDTVSRGDDVALWLESRGFNRLLIEHLESKLPTLDGEEQADEAMRLARLYAGLLLNPRDEEDRAWLEVRGSQLLEDIPSGQADDLRVELLNGRYLAAEDVAERHRLRLDDLGEVAKAIASLDDIASKLQVIRERTIKAVKSSARSVDRGTPYRATSRRQRLARQEQLLRRTEYLLAWTYAYRGWLGEDEQSAEQAVEMFALVLDLELNQIEPGQVSLDRRSEEAVAWAVLGMAFSRSMTRSSTTAMRWLDLLEIEQVPEAVSSVLPAWRLAILLEAAELSRVALLLDELEADGGVLPTTWWRLVAVHALEQETADARVIADRAIAALAARNALDHLYDLVERYDDTLASETGFAMAYARGVLKYKDAQDQTVDGRPLSPKARDAYRKAAAQLQEAMQEHDRDQWGDAMAGCASLLGWCYWHEGDLESSRDAFLQAAGEGLDAAHEEAFWMAIVSEDRRVAELAEDEGQNVLAELINEYMVRWPTGARAGALTVRRIEDAVPSLEAVEELTQLSPDDPAWDSAQLRAAQMLYALFTERSGSERSEAGSQYLTVALPLLAQDSEMATRDAAAAGRCMARARRVLEVALDKDVLRLVAAEAALNAVRDRDGYPMEVPEGFEAELEYRRLQIALTRDEIIDAERLGVELLQQSYDELWTRLAARAIFRYSLDRWNEAGPIDDVREDLRRISEWGGRILGEHTSLDSAIDAPGMLAVAANVARAGLSRWESSGDDELGNRVWVIYGSLLDRHPKNQQFLRGRALLSPAMGDADEAMRCWRVVLAGTAAGSEPWFEARSHQIQLLLGEDPERARQVLQQHRVLYPDWGPAPWGERMQRMFEQIEFGEGAP